MFLLIFWLCASVMSFGHCVVAAAGCNWYLCDINIFHLSKKWKKLFVTMAIICEKPCANFLIKSLHTLHNGKEGVSLYKFIFRNWASPAIEIGPFSTLHKPDYEASCKLHLSCVMARLLYASFYNALFHIAFFSQTAFFILCFW